MAEAKKAAAARPGALQRGQAKQQVLAELYAQLVPDNGGHRPLSPEERKVQKANALTVEERTALQKHLYSQFVAVERIYHDGKLAYAPGHRVPASAVERYGYDTDGLVAPITQAAG